MYGLYVVIVSHIYHYIYAPSQFSLAKDETITLISGTKSHTLSITSLIFTTSKGHTHKYGDGGGTEFRVPVNRKIIGFKGSYVDSLTDLDAIV